MAAAAWRLVIRELINYQHADMKSKGKAERGGRAPLAPPGVTLVAASGIKTRTDIARYEAAGIRAFLIGETLVTQTDPGAKLREFVGRELEKSRHQGN